MTKTVALTLAGALSFAASAFAQGEEPGASPNAPRGTMEVVPPPDWSIRKEVDRLDESMREYSSLINNLSTASDDLGEEFQAYLKDPNNTLLASSVEVKMARYAQSVMADCSAPTSATCSASWSRSRRTCRTRPVTSTSASAPTGPGRPGWRSR